MLHSVTYENYRQHSALDIEFKKGVNIVVAPNGFGKSNLLEGWRWSVFGTQGMKGKQERVVQWGKDSCRVQSVMDVAGSPVTFFRHIPRTGSVSSKVEENNIVVSESPAATRQYLEDNGIDWNSASMIYAQQRELSYFVHAIPSVRKELISSLFQIGMDPSIDHVIQDLKLLKAEVLEVASDTEGLIAEYEGILTGLAERRAEQHKFIRASLAEIDMVVLKIQEYGDIDEDQIKKRQRLESTKNAFSDSIFTLMTERKTLVSFLERPGRPKPLSKNYEKKLAKAGKEHRRSQSSWTEAMEEERRMQVELERLKIQVRGVERGKCVTCGYNYHGDDADVIEELNTIIREREVDLDSYRENQMRHCKDMVGVTSVVSHKLLQQAKDVKIFEQEGEEYTDRVAEIDVSVEELQVSIRRVSSELNDVPEHSTEDYIEWNSLKLKRSDLADQVSSKVTEVEGIEKDRSGVKERRDFLVKQREDMAEKRQRILDLKALRKLLPAFRDKILSDNLVWVSNRATTLLSQATMDTWEITVNDELAIEVNGHPVYDYSTGQVDLICVALRIAIAEFLSAFGLRGLLILDGVFDSVDETNIAAVGRLVSQISVEQVIILSHFDIETVEGAHKIILGESDV